MNFLMLSQARGQLLAALAVVGAIALVASLLPYSSFRAPVQALQQPLVRCDDRTAPAPERLVPPTLDSGFDESGHSIYNSRWSQLEKEPTRELAFPVGGLTARVTDGGNRNFWQQLETKAWEPHTFVTLFHYIDPATVVIDFGTWIGPTVLFGAQLGAKTYGIEADPAAIAEMRFNLQLNSARPWYRHVHLTAACVGTSEGPATMRSAGAGNSMSSMTKFFQETGNSRVLTWQVNCWTLPRLFAIWGVDPAREHVFIKVDIESFECRLMPSWLAWLQGLSRRPTLFFSMHPQIQSCANDEYEVIEKIAALYRFKSRNWKGFRTGNTFVLSDIRPPLDE